MDDDDVTIEPDFPLTLGSIGETIGDEIGSQSPGLPPVSAATLESLQANLYDLTTTDSKLGLYDVYGIKTEWFTDTMKLAVPIAAGPDVTDGLGCRVAVLGAAYGYKVVNWIVIRKKFPPSLPAVEESQYCQLVNSTIGALNDTTEPDNITVIFSRTGQYVYVLSKPIQPGVDTMETPAAVPVFTMESVDIDPEDFTPGMAPVDPDDE